jgi:hypothetical protein
VRPGMVAHRAELRVLFQASESSWQGEDVALEGIIRTP